MDWRRDAISDNKYLLNRDKLYELGISPEDYFKLSPEERSTVDKVLEEVINGNLSDYDELFYSDYEEIPVDFITFITDNRYLGKSTRNGRFLYPFWKEEDLRILKAVDNDGISEVALSGCLSGDTLIPLLDGTEVTIKELAESGRTNFKVYSYDLTSNKFTVGNAVRAFSTGYKLTYNVIFDNGKSVRITGNHKFLTRDKHYRSIDDGLSVGDSIMPFTTYLDCKGYGIIRHPQKDGTYVDEYIHRMVMRSKRGDCYQGTVHHKDENKRNNLPSNLFLFKSPKDHWLYHSRHGGSHFREFNRKYLEGDLPQETYSRISEGRLKGTRSRWSSPLQHELASIRATERNKGNTWGSFKTKESRDQARCRLVEYNKTLHPRVVRLTKISDQEIVNAASSSFTRGQMAKQLNVSLTGLSSLVNSRGIVPEDYFMKTPFNLPNRYWTPRLTIYNSILSREGVLNDEVVQKDPHKLPLVTEVVNKYFEGDFSKFYDIVKNFNHKITSITLEGFEEVYDIEVDKYHNFALSAGIVVHNSIGSGKSTNGILLMIYHLYRTMCMRDPQSFFRLAPGSLIAYAFLNNTLSSSYGVAYQTFQAFIQESPWFLKRGKIVGREYPEYLPEKGFKFIVGSRPQHTLGQHVICLTGDTIIETSEGPKRIDSLLKEEIKVYSYDINTDTVQLSSPCYVQVTSLVTKLYEITLSDNTVIRCTSDHRLLVVDKGYTIAAEIKVGDRLHNLYVTKSTKVELNRLTPVYDVINAYPYHNFLIRTNSNEYVISHNCAIMDEVSFAPGQNINYERAKIFDTYANIKRRMESRFMIQGRNYGLMLLVSSKSTESSFLEAYIADQVKKGYPIYVVDQPLWVIKPGAYSGKTFKVAVGNKYIPSRIEPDNLTTEQLTNWINSATESGLRVIDVPVEHRQAFDQNLDKALQDIAGISTATVTKAFSSERILKCISPTYHNPFTMDVVTVGLNDNLQLRDFFLVNEIPEEVKSAPIFIHLDASLTGDRTGLSGVAIIGTKHKVLEDSDTDNPIVSEELLYQQVFTVGIQAPSDSEISFEKTRQFIYYLKDEVGLNIKYVSADGYQSSDFKQILTTKGYETKYISLDRTPDGYDGLRSAIYDQRIVLLQGCNLLFDELSDLERDNMTRRYDHPLGSSKDSADSLAGAFLSASQYKDEFLFFSPKDYDYEDINKRDSYEDSYRKNLVSGILSSDIIPDNPTYRRTFNDDNILIL